MSFPFQPDGGWMLRGLGAVLFKRARADGNEGFHFLGQCTKLELSLNDEKLIENSAVQKETPPIIEIVTKRTPKAALTLKETHPHNIALALMGLEDTATQAATAVTDEVHNNVKAGTFVKLDKMGPVTAVTVEPAGGGTAFDAGDDYVVYDGEIAMIYIVPGGGIDDGDDIQVDYTPTAYTAAPIIPIGTKTLITGELLYVPDPSIGPKYVANIWRCSVSSEAVLPLIQSEAALAQYDLSFTVLSDTTNHPNSPYGLLTKVGAVSAS